MDMASDIISVTLPETEITRQIQRQQRFIKWGQAWEIQGIDYSKAELIILNCKITTFNKSNDDMENEIADRWIDSVDILDGNIEPTLPFDETIPDEPTEPEDPPIEDNFTYSIEGASEIMWNMTKTYTLKKFNNGVEVDAIFTFALEGEYADIVGTTDNTVDIKAKNSVYGYVTLKATDTDNGEVVTKEILIKGLI